MGVYIKDMEMPERCIDCRFYQDKWCYAYIDSDGSRFKYLGGSKPKFCPLVSLESQDILNCKPTAIKSTEVPWWITGE